MQYYLLAFICFVLSSSLSAQTVSGHISDEDGDLISANVAVYSGTDLIVGTSTDFDGEYCLGLGAGTYNFEFSYIGYPTKRIEGIEVSPFKTYRINVNFVYEEEDDDEDFVLRSEFDENEIFVNLWYPTSGRHFSEEQVRRFR